MNLADDQDNTAFLDSLSQRHPSLSCLLKATSYTLHQPSFSGVRDFIIDHCATVMQDDSGIPVKYLAEDFELNMFGHYKAPYGAEFKSYLQKDLVALTKETMHARPFCFGYGCGRQQGTFILAQKNAR